MFVVYLYYKYKLSEDIRIHDVGKARKLPSQQCQLNTIAIAMGATIGLSQPIFCLFIIIIWLTSYCFRRIPNAILHTAVCDDDQPYV